MSKIDVIAGSKEAKRCLQASLDICLNQKIDFFDNDGDRVEFDYIRVLEGTYWRTFDDVLRLHSNSENASSSPKIVEMGSYLGVISLAMRKAGFEVIAQDIPEFINHPAIQARYRDQGISWKAVNLRSYCLPYEDGSLDGVIMCELLEHLNFNPVPVLVEVNRVLKPGGWFYVGTPNAGNIVRRLRLALGLTIMDPVDYFFEALTASTGKIVGMHWREYMGYELQELLGRTGFSIKRHYYCQTSNLRHPNVLRRGLVALMYRLFPAFQSSQVISAHKSQPAAVMMKFTDATKPPE